jgi:hypothetical protein
MRKYASFLVLLLTISGLVALVLLAGRPAAPPPAPPPPSPALAADYADAVEDAVMEVEEMLLDLSHQIRRGAAGGALYHVAADFEGSPLLRDADGAPRRVGEVEIRTSGADPRKLDREGLRATLGSIVPHGLIFKLPGMELRDGVLAGALKLDAVRTEKGRSKRWVCQGAAEFVKQGGRWRLRRFQGSDAKTEEGPVRFFDATAVLGLVPPPEADDRAASKLTFGRVFLGGIAAGDFDGDGDDDLFFPQVGPDGFFRNDGGRFVECARELGLSDPDAGASGLFLDYDNDGDLDLVVTNYEPRQIRERESNRLVDNAGHRAVALYRNDGGKFTDVTEKAGIRSLGPATSVCAADVDRDGDLDFFVCMYFDDSKEDPRFVEELPASVYQARDGEADQLWINQGDGTFREEAARRGVADPGWGLAAGFADFDDDGDPDLFVANDYGDKKLFRNRGDGTFEDVTPAAGTADTGFGMSVCWFDYDRDGDLDLYVSNMYSTAGNRILSRGPGRMSTDRHAMLLKLARGNTLFRNDGGGKFTDVTREAGGGRAGWAWSAVPYDYDNDGLPDLYVANGGRTSHFATSDL